MPACDDQTQFEFLILEGAQAGLSWSTILNKREGYREAFAGFDPERIARFGKRERGAADERRGHRAQPAEDRVGDRQRARLPRVPGAARQLRATPVALRRRQADPEPLRRSTSRCRPPAAESDALSKDLKKRGFRFVGSTIIYAHMQATGMVNDHLASCFRHKECKKLGKPKSG